MLVPILNVNLRLLDQKVLSIVTVCVAFVVENNAFKTSCRVMYSTPAVSFVLLVSRMFKFSTVVLVVEAI